MSRSTLKGINKVRKKLAHGQVVRPHYLRSTGKCFWRSDGVVKESSPEYIAAYQAAQGVEDRGAVGASSRDDLNGLVRKMLESAYWHGLATRTQEDLRRGLVDIERKWGDCPSEALESPQLRDAVVTWVEKNWKFKAADLRIHAFKRVLSWAGPPTRHMPHGRGLLQANPLQGVPEHYQGSDRRNVIWLRAELDRFEATAERGLCRAVALMSETALRPGRSCPPLIGAHHQDAPWQSRHQHAHEQEPRRADGADPSDTKGRGNR